MGLNTMGQKCVKNCINCVKNTIFHILAHFWLGHYIPGVLHVHALGFCILFNEVQMNPVNCIPDNRIILCIAQGL